MQQEMELVQLHLLEELLKEQVLEQEFQSVVTLLVLV